MYGLERWTVYVLTRWLLWRLFPELQSNRANNIKITIEWAHKLHYSISYKIWGANKWRSKSQILYIDIVPNLVSLRSGDDVTIDCAKLVMTEQVTL